MRLLRRLCVIYTLSAILLALAGAAVRPAPARQDHQTVPIHGAVWIEHHWVSTPPSKSAVSALCGQLRAHQIDTIYVHVGPADASGRIADARAPYAGQFAASWHMACPGVEALAWIGQLLPVWDGILDLERGNVRDGLVASAARFARLGYDGVQFDLEPVPDGDAAFLDLLRRAHAALGEKRLAVAAPAIVPPQGLPALPHLQLPLTPWSATYYARVAALVDELDPMLYVTALQTPEAYEQFVAEQASDLARALPAAHLRLALPAFHGHDAHFNEAVENISTGLLGLSRAFGGSAWPRAIDDVAFYPLWQMTAGDWASYDRWRAQRS